MPSPIVRIIVAYSENRAIGRNNTLPWRLPGDLAHFKRTTLGQPIIMGRNTWDSLGRPLPGRRNVVVSRNPGFTASGASVHGSLTEALAACRAEPGVCIIGGAQIYAQALEYAHEIIATEVHAQVDGDAFFPSLNKAEWQETERLPQAEENGYRYDFVTYRRKPA
ncbi:dihydrofolate reductase [Paralcaligenes ginsengisoli]